MTKTEYTKIAKDISGKQSNKITDNLLQLHDFCCVVRRVSKSCFDKIYQADTLNYKIQSEYCEEWETLLEWDKVEKTGTYNHYYIGDLRVTEEECI